MQFFRDACDLSSDEWHAHCYIVIYAQAGGGVRIKAGHDCAECEKNGSPSESGHFYCCGRQDNHDGEDHTSMRMQSLSDRCGVAPDGWREHHQIAKKNLALQGLAWDWRIAVRQPCIKPPLP